MRTETITINDIRKKCSDLIMSGENNSEAVRNALSKFGVQKITQIQEADYPRFMECLDSIM